MRYCPVIVLVLALLCGSVAIGSPPGTPEQGTPEKISVSGGGRSGPLPDLSDWEAMPAIRQAVAAARSYWSAQEPDYTEDVRVLATASGAFTRPGVEQHAVLYRMSLYPRGFPKKGLAVLEGERLVRNIAFTALHDDVWALPDVDGDGRYELVFAQGFMQGGQVSQGIRLAVFGEEGLQDLGMVDTYESACGAGYEGSTSAEVWVVPGSPMMIQQYSQSSCEATEWEPQGEPAALELTSRDEALYEDISTN